MNGRRVVLFVNTRKQHALEAAHEIGAFLSEHGVTAHIHDSLSSIVDAELAGISFALSLGGDGTVLAASRAVSHHGVPIFPINLGNFGFITEVGKDDWQDDLERYIKDGLEVCDRLMVRAEVFRNGKSVFVSRALNDVVVSGAGISKLIRLHVSLKNGELGNYKADGIIIATPTGSTAYSAAAGGPILHPEMEALIVNPICPFTLSHRPIVLPATETIVVRVQQQQRTNVILTIDGQIPFELKEDDLVNIRTAETRARIAYSYKRNFYDVLRAKLNWSGGPDA